MEQIIVAYEGGRQGLDRIPSSFEDRDSSGVELVPAGFSGLISSTYADNLIHVTEPGKHVPHAVAVLLLSARGEPTDAQCMDLGWPDVLGTVFRPQQSELQWRCAGSVDGVTVLHVVLNGQEQRLTVIQAQVPDSTTTTIARQTFLKLALATPALGDALPEVQEWLRTWQGGSAAQILGSSAIQIYSDTAWVTLTLQPPVAGRTSSGP